MADPTIPPPGADGYWHFTYITTDPIDGRWYGGRHSTKLRGSLNRYIGSGNWIKQHPARERLKREIVAFYATSAEVCVAEVELVTWNKVFDDPLCMNLRDGGEGVTPEGARVLAADPAWRMSVIAAASRVHQSEKARANHRAATLRNFADPEFCTKHEAGIIRRNSDPQWIANHAAAMRKNGTNIDRNTKISAKLRICHADPAWLAKFTEVCRRVAATPEWLQKNEAQRQRLYADPIACAKRDAANRKRLKDPKWLAKNIAATRRRAADPIIRQQMAKVIRQTMKDPTWRAAHLAGVRKRSANPEWLGKQSAAAFGREAAKRAARAIKT